MSTGPSHDAPVMRCPTCGAANAADARFCSQCGQALASRVTVEERRYVAAIFADLVGSTSLGERTDPEVMRGVVGGFFELAADEIRRHGGSVEQFGGDAVLGLFGLQAAHEDDAERAIRAALAIRERLGSLREETASRHGMTVEARFGIEAGEVVVGDPYGGRTMATGDTMNLAARLEQQASPGEILIGRAAFAAARHAVQAEPLGAIAVRGKAEEIEAWRVLGATAEPGGARGVPGLTAPLTGRQEELTQLLHAARRTRAAKKAILFTVLGTPGVGKSRLARELADRLADEATIVLRGRCLPYGDGITYWPLNEMVRSWASITPEMTAADALDRLAAASPEPAVAERLAFAIGLRADMPSEEAVDTEIAWAVRRLFESLDESGSPLLFIFEDIHWAEPALLDLIEYLATWLRGVPALVLCLSRPELLDRRQTWGAAGRIESSRIQLEPLTRAESGELLAALLAIDGLPEPMREQVLERAEGNPLYVEEVVRMLIDRGEVVREGSRWVAIASAGNVTVPESIESLIRARLDTLPREDRRLLQTASVVGRVFQRSAMAALHRDEGDLDRRLDEAVLRDLIIPERAADRDPTYRFKHILIRDVAYAALPKAQRAELHVGVADWLARWAGERRDEFVEIEAYHLEQAALLQRELHGAAGVHVEGRAVEALARSATLSLGRDDLRAAERFARRALALEPRDAGRRVDAKWLLTEALMNQNQIGPAGLLGTEVAQEAGALGREDLRGRALLAVATAQWIGPDAVGAEGALRTLAEARHILEEVGDRTYLFEVLYTTAFGDWADGRLGAAVAAWREAAEVAESIPDPGRQARVVLYIARCLILSGQWEAAVAELGVAERLAERAGSRRMLLETARFRASSVTAARSPVEAAAELEKLLPMVDEIGDQEVLEAVASQIGDMHRLAGDVQTARSWTERALQISRSIGHGGRIPEVEATLTEDLLELGEVDLAEAHALQAVETAMEWDVTARARALAALGQVRLRQRRTEEAEELLRRAVAIIEPTEYRAIHHELTTPLACLLLETGRTAEGEEWLERARASARTWGEESAVVRRVDREAQAARSRAAAPSS